MRSSGGGARLEWEEASPARPGRVRAVNRSSVSVLVEAGTLVVGGMADRATVMTTIVSPHGDAELRVVPLGARWWNEGGLRVGGELEPAQRALVVRAAFGVGPAAASARTLLGSPGFIGRR